MVQGRFVCRLVLFFALWMGWGVVSTAAPEGTSEDTTSGPAREKSVVPVPQLEYQAIGTTLTGTALNVETTGTLRLPDIAEFEAYLHTRSPRRLTIGLNEVVVRTLAKNLNIKVSELATQAAKDEINAQKGIYDLRLSGSLGVDRTNTPVPYKNGPPTGQPESLKQRDYSAQMSVGQLLPSGGLIELLFQQSTIENNNPFYFSPYYATGAGVQVSQPLLKNAGRFVTESGILLAQYAERIAKEAYRGQLLAELTRSISIYYELIYVTANVEVLRISLAQAQELLRVNTAKYNAGVLPELDVLQAKADVAARQQLLITALQQVEDISDQLKNQLAEITELEDVTLVPLDLPEVPDYQIRGKEEQFIRDALLYRPEFEQIRLEFEQAQIRRDVARNQKLPQLDLFARYLAISADNTPSDAWEGTTGNDYGNWCVGIQFSYPLQNRAARYRYLQAEKGVQSAALMMQKVHNDIIQDVRASLRAVETNRQQIEVGKATVEFNREKVETGMRRQQVGLATSFEVLQFQTALASARSNLLRAIIDYNKSIVQLERAKGTLLQRFGISPIPQETARQKRVTGKSSAKRR